MKLTNKSLMIGDWVMYPQPKQTPIYLQVEGLSNDGVYTSNSFYSYGLLEPVPLTEEILKKNGFFHNLLPIFQSWDGYGLRLFPMDGIFEIHIIGGAVMEIKYVHQFQHALCLAGAEHKIIL